MHKSKRLKTGRVKQILCLRCGEIKPRSAFTENDKLDYGVLPWCDSCLPKLGTDRFSEIAEQYQKDYQKRYHAKRGKESFEKQGKRATARGVQRLTKKVMEKVLPKKLTIVALRRLSVYTELMKLLPRLQETDTWEKFEEEIVKEAKKKYNKRLRIGSIRRLLPIPLYLELALVKENCFMNAVAVVEPITEDKVEKGLERLAKCIVEVGYYV